MTTNPAVAQVVQAWEAKAALQREDLEQAGADLQGYRLVGATALGQTMILHGRTDRCTLRSIVDAAGRLYTVGTPLGKRAGESLS